MTGSPGELVEAIVSLAGVCGTAGRAEGDRVVVGVSAIWEGVLVTDVAAVAADVLDGVGGVLKDLALLAQRRPALIASREPGSGLGFGVVVVEMCCIAGLLNEHAVFTDVDFQCVSHVDGHRGTPT